MKKSHEDLKFSTLKIKKIIQENKDIGKIANMTPYIICMYTLTFSKIARILFNRCIKRMFC